MSVSHVAFFLYWVTTILLGRFTHISHIIQSDFSDDHPSLLRTNFKSCLISYLNVKYDFRKKLYVPIFDDNRSTVSFNGIYWFNQRKCTNISANTVQCCTYCTVLIFYFNVHVFVFKNYINYFIILVIYLHTTSELDRFSEYKYKKKKQHFLLDVCILLVWQLFKCLFCDKKE